MSLLTNEQINCLNGWPEGTIGHVQEQIVIWTLNHFCQEHGYGRIKQIVDGIHDIWTNPEMQEKFESRRSQRMALLKDSFNLSTED